MAGGVIQLIAFGSESLYLVGNPEFSYFRLVMKRHTNFSMESIRLPFITKPVLEYSSRTTYTCRIGRNADLLKEIYLSFRLPDIFSNGIHRFQWIKKLAQYMIHRYTIRIDTQIIDEGYGEWMDIWNELSLPSGKQAAYDKMTGNIDEYTNPRTPTEVVIVDDQEFAYSYYPDGKNGTPSIPSRRFYVPLPTWFSRSPGLCLPLVALQYQQIDVTIEFRALEELYQVFDKTLRRYVSPATFMQLHKGKVGDDLSDKDVHQGDVTFRRFLTPETAPLPTLNTLDIDAYLEVNYIYLGEEERRAVAGSAQEYIVERVVRIEQLDLSQNHTLDLILNHPIKEIVWITRRSDVNRYNEWSNFTDRIPDFMGQGILQTAKFMFNGLDRFEEKDASYFNLIQPYQHHTNSPREGIYAYSFAIYPERINPSGHVNASMISSFQMAVTLKEKDPSESYNYDIIVYSVFQNMFRVMGGLGSMVFSG